MHVPAQLLTSDGLLNGQITIDDTCAFVVGHIVILSSSTQGTTRLQVKRVTNSSTLFLGRIDKKIDDRVDLTSYLVADGASIEASEQPRPTVPEQEIERLTYDEESVIARRVVIVDKYGAKVSDDNPLPVSATVVPTIVGTPAMFNVSCPTAGIEYSQLLPNNTAQMQLRARNSGAKLQLAWTLGNSNSEFLTLIPGNIYVLESVKLTNKSIYFTSNKNNTVVEILSWS